MGTCYPIMERNFAGWVVGDGTRVMMMRPVRTVVIVLFDLIYLVFGFNVSMFRNANINADVILWNVFPINSAIFQRFSDAVDRQTARASSAPKFATRLVL